MADTTQSKALFRVAYVHRYPVETEAVYFSAMRPLIRRLIEHAEFWYLGMRGVGPPDIGLRAGIQVRELPLRVDPRRAWSKWSRTLLYYAWLPVTLRRLKALKPDWIICKETLPLVAWQVSRLNVPTLIAASDWWLSTLLGGSALGRRIAKLVENWEVRRWNAAPRALVLVHTREDARLLAARGMAPERIRIVRAAYFPGEYGPCGAADVRAALGLTAREWAVAIHGNIRPGKGYGQLLRWWQELALAHPHWRLLILGGSGGVDWCRRQVRRLGLGSKVLITGWLPSARDINRHLNAADCLLVMRRNSEDNRGIIPSGLYHNLATGKPTVATGLPGMAEVIEHGVTGYLFAPDDAASFRSVLEYVAAHPREAAGVGQAGRRRCADYFDPDKVVAGYIDIMNGGRRA